MKSNAEYRFEMNPKEKKFHDKFKEEFEGHSASKIDLSAICFGWTNDYQSYPKDYLTEREENICLRLIQWLGSPVGEGFLSECGFIEKKL